MKFFDFIVLLAPLLAFGGQTAKHQKNPGEKHDYFEETMSRVR
jgi:hypothetical protein